MSGHSRRPGDWAIGVHAPEHPREAAVLAVETFALLELVGQVMGAASDAARLRALRLVEHQLSHVKQSATALRDLFAPPASRPSGATKSKAAARE